MPSPETIDIAKLTAEIPGDTPVGPNLKDDPEYFEIKGLRRSAQRAESRLRDAWEKEGLEEPDWKSLWSQSRPFLQDRSKDLWVAAWLTEAALRIHGFAGLRDGFRLLNLLIAKYWEVGLNPQPELGDSAETIISQIVGLNESLAMPIAEVKIAGDFNSLDYDTAVSVDQETDPDERQVRIDQGATTMEEFKQAVSQVSPDKFTELFEDICECIDALKELSDTMDEHCRVKESEDDDEGRSIAPSWSSTLDVIDDCKRRIINIAPHVEVAADVSDETDGGEGAGQIATVNSGVGPAIGSGAVATREEAFQLLERVANFFEKTEPQSPVPYQLRRAVRWGRMPLEQWLKEVMAEDGRSELFNMVGIKVENADDDEATE